jgi:hypothetical protein
MTAVSLRLMSEQLSRLSQTNTHSTSIYSVLSVHWYFTLPHNVCDPKTCCTISVTEFLIYEPLNTAYLTRKWKIAAL